MLQKPRGTRDFLPDEMEQRREVEGTMRRIASNWGYREVCTPEFEELELFTIRSGEGIIQEMYVFEDKGGRKLALRPEITAPVLRLYVNQGKTMPKPLRWFYFADCFRYERPQKGRYRQFWQFGIELIGVDSALAEAEVILLARDLLAACGISFSIHIGHLSFMRSLLSGLDPDDQKKIRMFLDKKDTGGLDAYLLSQGMEELFDKLTALTESRSLDDIFAITGDLQGRDRIEELFSILDGAGLEYTLNPGIARGLDYYTGMVFEIFSENLGAENQVLGGGTYSLAHLFGGEETPSCGFAIGFDRVMVARGQRESVPVTIAGVAFTPGGRDWAMTVAGAFRKAGIRTELVLSGKSLGNQISQIARSADYALIIGDRERDLRQVTVKNLRTGRQEALPLPDAIREVYGSEPR
ncbi:MAG TPA: histidine--tRNA ligase [Methanoregulaceae archaeon]|nr:MAG: histidine--tRNA ligase [Methanolinea sp.]HON81154.1 histidine--tRNA ligase [Methanoregulaceae archaeon]HPD09902.1 histidine--tRNA ligase [Methanoregulaceae archaeon]HRT14907.1 histidine--tRNA ligase [Methanoregulaceae archaeon]HRU30478.1 histidine--tRNA ligase [Methanoregulaceae archaeon]